jgi:antitoxin component YwqK of YwqJK toxin-antitoxin module
MKSGLFMLLLLVLLSATIKAQVPEPCKSTRQVCPRGNVKYCHESVAFDEEHNLYLLRKDYATPYNGTCVSCFPSFTIEEKLNFVNGRRQGTDTSFYQSGCLQSIQSYQIGLQDGPTYVFYDSTNRVQYEIWYQAGQLNGPSIQFSRNARADTLMYKHYKSGKLDGPQRTYLPNGKLRKISNYREGLAEGAQITYNASAQKESELFFKAGKKHGTWTYYFDSGQTARTETWKDGKKNGLFVSYNELGKVLSSEKYAMGLPIGLHQTFYADGKLNYSCSYSNKGEKLEEYVIDQYGVKKQLFPQTNGSE